MKLSESVATIRKELGRAATKRTVRLIERILADEARRQLYKDLKLDMSTADGWVPAPLKEEPPRDQGGEREESEI